MKTKILFSIIIAVIVIVTLVSQLFFCTTEGNAWWYVTFLPFQFCFFGILGYKLTYKNVVLWTLMSIPVYLLLSFQFDIIMLHKLLAIAIGGFLFVIIMWIIRKIAK